MSLWSKSPYLISDLEWTLCSKVAGATSAPLTTAKPCVDKYSNCASLAQTNCKKYGESCAKVSLS